MAGLAICGDFDTKNIHDAISCGRRNIVISKSIGYCVIIALLTLPYAIAGFVGFVSEGEFQSALAYSTNMSMMANPSNYPVDGAGIAKAIEVLLINIVLYAARLSFCIPIAFKVKKSVVVTVVGVVLGFLCDFFVNMISKIPVLDTIVEYTPFSYPMISLDMGQGELLKILCISIGFIVLMIALTNVLFKKDEIK